MMWVAEMALVKLSKWSKLKIKVRLLFTAIKVHSQKSMAQNVFLDIVIAYWER